MPHRIDVADLRVDRELYAFIAEEALPGTGVSELDFWHGFADLIHDLAPKNRDLLAKRDAIQTKIDGWYRANGAPADLESNIFRPTMRILPMHPENRWAGPPRSEAILLMITT